MVSDPPGDTQNNGTYARYEFGAKLVVPHGRALPLCRGALPKFGQRRGSRPGDLPSRSGLAFAVARGQQRQGLVVHDSSQYMAESAAQTADGAGTGRRRHERAGSQSASGAATGSAQRFGAESRSRGGSKSHSTAP